MRHITATRTAYNIPPPHPDYRASDHGNVLSTIRNGFSRYGSLGDSTREHELHRFTISEPESKYGTLGQTDWPPRFWYHRATGQPINWDDINKPSAAIFKFIEQSAKRQGDNRESFARALKYGVRESAGEVVVVLFDMLECLPIHV